MRLRFLHVALRALRPSSGYPTPDAVPERVQEKAVGRVVYSPNSVRPATASATATAKMVQSRFRQPKHRSKDIRDDGRRQRRDYVRPPPRTILFVTPKAS